MSRKSLARLDELVELHRSIVAEKDAEIARLTDLLGRIGKACRGDYGEGEDSRVLHHLPDEILEDKALQREMEERAEVAEGRVSTLTEALNRIGTECEHFTHGSCRDSHSGKTHDAKDWADRWCDGCIAADALEAVAE